MGLRVKLDDIILADTPKGWDEAEIKSKRGKTLKGLFLTYTSSLDFWGDGFDYINNVMEANYCETIKVTIETSDCSSPELWIVEFNGVIQIPQIDSFDVSRNIISTKIFDDTFDAKINNNKSIKAFVDVGISKNGDSITPATPISVSMFNPINDFNLTWRNCEGFRVFDCFKFIIDHITDESVGFKSDLFSGEFYNWMLFNGKELRTGSGGGDQLEVSFKELYVELNKKCNISFAIEPDDSGSFDYRLRLEDTSYFEQDDAIITLDNIPSIEMSFNKSELYSNVEIGSDSFDDDIVLSYPPLNLKAFKKEDYTTLGQCNIDKALNLVSKYVIDTNVIEDVVVNTSEKYDKKTFLIVTDGSKAIKYKEYDTPVSEGGVTSTVANQLRDTTATFIVDGVAIGDMAANITTGDSTTVTSISSNTRLILSDDIFVTGDNYQIRTAPYNYNDPLTNIKVIERFNGGLPNSVIKYLSTANTANFLASTTTPLIGSQNPVGFNDDSTPPNFDTGGFYDNTTFKYTIPNNGLYGFRSVLPLRLNGLMSTNHITNGEFASDTGWQFPTGNVSNDRFNISFAYVGFNSYYLQQFGALDDGFTYRLTFDITIENGTMSVYGNTISESGSYDLGFDTLSSSGNSTFRMSFSPDGGQFEATVTNIVLKSTPKFTIQSEILRSSNNGSVLQSFSNSEEIIFNYNEYQKDFDFINERTFSTFKDELITVKYTATALSGSSLISTIKDEATFQTVLVDDGGGDILPIEDSSFPIYKYKFEKGLSFAEFKLLKDSPEKAVFFSNIDSGHIFGWRNSIDYDRKTGNTTFELRSKTKIKKSCQTG